MRVTSPARRLGSAERGPSVFDKLTDSAGYTGASKQRFDRQGRGRGLAGRDSTDKSSQDGQWARGLGGRGKRVTSPELRRERRRLKKRQQEPHRHGVIAGMPSDVSDRLLGTGPGYRRPPSTEREKAARRRQQERAEKQAAEAAADQFMEGLQGSPEADAVFGGWEVVEEPRRNASSEGSPSLGATVSSDSDGVRILSPGQPYASSCAVSRPYLAACPLLIRLELGCGLMDRVRHSWTRRTSCAHGEATARPPSHSTYALFP